MKSLKTYQLEYLKAHFDTLAEVFDRSKEREMKIGSHAMSVAKANQGYEPDIEEQRFLNAAAKLKFKKGNLKPKKPPGYIIAKRQSNLQKDGSSQNPRRGTNITFRPMGTIVSSVKQAEFDEEDIDESVFSFSFDAKATSIQKSIHRAEIQERDRRIKIRKNDKLRMRYNENDDSAIARGRSPSAMSHHKKEYDPT